MTVTKRLAQFIQLKNISIRSLEIAIDASNGSLGSQLRKDKVIGSDRIEKILHLYPNLSAEWLMRGVGAMLIEAEDRSLRSESYAVSLAFTKRSNPESIQLRCLIVEGGSPQEALNYALSHYLEDMKGYQLSANSTTPVLN